MNHEAPKKIWLQVDPDGEAPIGSEYPLCEGATWCQDRINDNDVAYFRADQLREVEQQRDELLLVLREVRISARMEVTRMSPELLSFIEAAIAKVKP